MFFYVQVMKSVAVVLLYTTCTSASLTMSNFENENFCKDSQTGPNDLVKANCVRAGYTAAGTCKNVAVKFPDHDMPFRLVIGVCHTGEKLKIACCITRSRTWVHFENASPKYCDLTDEGTAYTQQNTFDGQKSGSSSGQHQTPPQISFPEV